jgi:antitoxin component YwqK of YwqJK toxin-antitoxin module
VKEEGNYSHGKRFGTCTEYYPSGTISRQTNYDSNGSIREVKKGYWENMSLLKEWSFTDSSGFEFITRYNKSGQVMGREGKLNGQ